MPVLRAIDYASVALGAVLLGHALQISNGFYSPPAILWLTLAITAVLVGALRLPGRLAPAGDFDGVVAGVLCAGIVSNLMALAVSAPGLYIEPAAPSAHPMFLAGIGAALIASAGLAVRPRLARRIWFPCLLVIAFLLGRWLIHASPRPEVDVITVHRSAIAALLEGHSPYSVVWPNIYGSDDAYPAGLSHGGYVYFGFPYPPASLLLSLLARVLARDVRYAQLAGLLIGTGFAGYLPRWRFAPLAATVVLFTPRIFFILEQGWTEPLAVCWLGLLLFLAARSRRGEAVAAGLLMAVKQHMAILLPLLVWYRRRHGDIGRYGSIALAVVAVLTVPFVIWDLAGFWRSVVWVQVLEPFRPDSLSYLTWLVSRGWRLPPPVLSLAPLVAVAAGLAVAWRWLPRTPSGLSLALGITLLLVFSVAKKAFCNYYFLALAAIAFAVAAADETDADRPAIPPAA